MLCFVCLVTYMWVRFKLHGIVFTLGRLVWFVNVVKCIDEAPVFFTYVNGKHGQMVTDTPSRTGTFTHMQRTVVDVTKAAPATVFSSLPVPQDLKKY